MSDFVNFDKIAALQEAKEGIIMREYLSALTKQTAELIEVVKEQEEQLNKLRAQLWSLEAAFSNTNEMVHNQRLSIRALANKGLIRSALEALVALGLGIAGTILCLK